MATTKDKERLAMNTPQVVSQQEWEAARQQLLLKEKALTRSRDALAAEMTGRLLFPKARRF